MKCWTCGAEATRSRELKQSIYFCGEIVGNKDRPKQSIRCFCDKCFQEYQKTVAEDEHNYILYKQKHMFEMAVRKIEGRTKNFYEYNEAIKAVEEYNLENLDKFDSTYEIITAIMLIHNRIRVKPQFKVGRYMVDFYLPDQKIALEIDGERHKQRKGVDSVRDQEIRKKLNNGTQTVRISTECIDMNPYKIVEAIQQVLKFREEGKVHWRDI